MADQEQLALLRQGTGAWNRWRWEHPQIQPDLSYADLRGADLRGRVHLGGADLRGARLNEAILSGAMLSEAILIQASLQGALLSGAFLRRAHLREADLREARLSYADLREADLGGACLDGAYLYSAHLRRAHLSYANLRNADLREVDLSHANLSYADLSGAMMGQTLLGGLDLQTVQGLETMKHFGESTVGIDTLARSQGSLPLAFLRGVGLPETLLPSLPSLFATPSRDTYYCISASRQDEPFAIRLQYDLQERGLRCWFAPYDLKPNDYFREHIDEAIQAHANLLPVLSGASMESSWVRYEVELALAHESEKGYTILFPICLDNAVLESSSGWAVSLRQTHHISDFSSWTNPDAYQTALEQFQQHLNAWQ